MTGIYRIINKVNGKCYVGKSVNIESRVNRHFCMLRDGIHVNSSGTSHFQNSFNKYGEDNFCWEVLEECNKDCLNERERYWISYYDSLNNGYNETVGGDGGDTFSFRSDEAKNITRKRRSHSASLNVVITNGEIEKRVKKDDYYNNYDKSVWRIGLSDSHKSKLKENHKGFTGLKKSSEHNKKMSDRFKGIPLSPEHRKNLSEAHKGYIMPESQKLNIGINSIDRVRVSDGVSEKSIKRSELSLFLEENKDWYVGTKPRPKRKGVNN